jgi:hypothetical protein
VRGPVLKQGRANWLSVGVPATVWGGGVLICSKFKFKNGFKSKFKSFQTLTDPKRTFSSSKTLKRNTIVKVLKKGTTLSIGTSPDSEGISNEN